MLPAWYTGFAATTGLAFVPGWTNADVVAVAFIVFAVLFIIAALLAADWPSDGAFITLVVGGLLVSWPAMIVLTMAAVVLMIIVSVLHAWIAPGRSARISAEAFERMAPKVDALAKEAGMDEASRRAMLDEVEREERRR